MIYAVSILKRQFVKVGFSANDDVARRISELQTGCPFKIDPVLTTFGNIQQEKRVHAALSMCFAQIRLPMPPNEWYPGRNGFFKEFLDYLKYGPEAAVAFCEHYDPAIGFRGVRADSKPRSMWTPNYKWPVRADYDEIRVVDRGDAEKSNPGNSTDRRPPGSPGRKRRAEGNRTSNGPRDQSLTGCSCFSPATPVSDVAPRPSFS